MAFRNSATARARLRYYDEAELAGVRLAWRAGDRRASEVVRGVVASAERAMKGRVPSVRDKTGVAPSGDKHDYFRLAPYWWPDPHKPDGLPYVRRDGVFNPASRVGTREGRAYDQTARQRFVDGLTALGLAWYFTGERKYASRAARFARAWFISPRTRMNPHFRYAQVWRGHRGDEGTGPGIIDFRELAWTLDALRLAIRSGALRPAEARKVRDWFAELLRWLQKSKQGREAARHKNNIGTCYELVVSSVALFLGNERLARKRLAAALHRLAAQLAPDGSQPAEDGRTRPLHYSIFNLELWADLGCVARTLGMDVWRVELADGVGLRRALASVMRRVKKKGTSAVDRGRARALARQAGMDSRAGRVVWGL